MKKHKNKKDTAAAEAAEAAVEQNIAVEENAAGQENAPAELEKLSAELKEQQDKLLYLQADYQNYRKRMVKEVADARMLGVSATLDPFLRVFDYLSMAKSAAEKSDNIESIRQGVEMIIAEYVKAFDDLGVIRMESVGKPFDPVWQEAVQQQPSDTVPDGVVIKEWSPAYKLGEKVLRAAKVVVSSGKAPEEDVPEADKE